MGFGIFLILFVRHVKGNVLGPLLLNLGKVRSTAVAVVLLNLRQNTGGGILPPNPYRSARVVKFARGWVVAMLRFVVGRIWVVVERQDIRSASLSSRHGRGEGVQGVVRFRS